MKLRSLHTVIYVAVIGIAFSFALCRGDKTEVCYYDFADITSYTTDFDNELDECRYRNIGLDEEKRNEIKAIMEDFDFTNVSPDSGFGRGQIMNYYSYHHSHKKRALSFRDI